MSYVSSNSKLPRNSYDPVTACEAARAAAIVSGMEESVQNAKWASAQIAGPNSFREFGPGVVIDVARSQNAMYAAGLPVNPAVQRPNVAAEMMAAPRVLPLNVTEQEYSGCEFRTGAMLPMPVAEPRITMPEPMSAPVVLPPENAKATTPTWKNICWALRNGAVDASQFNPDELMKAQFACSQLGYTGACVPPPLVALYLDQQRRAGTLPHLSTGDLATIPQAPDYIGNCPDSWKQGGLVGYRRRRGLGAPWGDKGTLPCGPTWGTGKASGAAGVSWTAWAWLAAAGVGLYAMGRR